MGKPFLHAHHRFKNGKDHCYWSLVEKVRGPHDQWVQRPILYLGEINDSQKAAWIRTIEVFDTDRQAFTQLALFPLQRELPAHVTDAVQVRLSEFSVQRPRQWGACWVACLLWQQLNLDAFWSQRLSASREGTDWKTILQVLTIYRLLDPGSEWRLHRQWWAGTALDELLGLHLPVLDKDCLYRTLDKLLAHRDALFQHLRGRWQDLFGARFDVLLYDLTSTHFESDPPIQYLVGTPKGRLSKLERELLDLPWQSARPQVRVKLLPQDQELYVFIQSEDRLKIERGVRLRKLRELVKRLKGLQQRQQQLSRDELLVAVGQAKEPAGRVFDLVEIHWPEDPQADARTFTFRLRRAKYRVWRRREGRYLLRTNLRERDPKVLWEYYLQLVEVEGAFKLLKDDLAVRPIFHQKESRVEAHIFVAFLAYCLSVTLRGQLRKLAGGLTSRAVLEKFAAIQMVDAHFPTTDGRELVFRRYTQPEKDQKILLAQLGWELPEQPPPRITAAGGLEEPAL